MRTRLWRCTQVEEAGEMPSSGQEDEALVKQRRSEKEEPLVMQRCRPPDEAPVIQQGGEEAMECPGLDHPGQNK